MVYVVYGARSVNVKVSEAAGESGGERVGQTVGELVCLTRPGTYQQST